MVWQDVILERLAIAGCEICSAKTYTLKDVVDADAIKINDSTKKVEMIISQSI